MWASLVAQGFPGSSVGKESACNAGDPGSMPGLGRSPGEGIGNPLQYSWASLMAQLVKNLPAMWETWVHSLGWEDPLEEGKATHSCTVAWKIPWTVWSMGSQSQTRLSIFHFPWWLSVSNAGDKGLIPGSWKIPYATEQLSPCATTGEPGLWSPCSAAREATAMRSPLTASREKPEQPQRPSTAKNK